MKSVFRLDAVSRPALWLIVGRGIGFIAAFVVPIVLVRLFDQTTFGTYKQLFLIFATLYGLMQVGIVESLYYFIPKRPANAGRYAANAVLTMMAVGFACTVALGVAAPALASWLRNPELTATLLPLGLFLTLMLMTAAFEIVLVTRQQYKAAAVTYAGSDLARAAFVLAPAMIIGSLQGVLWGLIAFAAARLVVMRWWFSRQPETRFVANFPLWRSQWTYTLPFAMAVTLEVVQGNLHHYLVASRFDPATFAIYAVGCLQIPLVDVVATSGANVLMVKMGEEKFDNRGPAALALWHDTMCRLAALIVPLTVFLMVMAQDIIVTLFTASYLPSVPVFMLWTLTMLSFVPCVDAMLRVQAQTRVLFGLNVLRLLLVVACTTWFLSLYGLPGAVLAVLGSTLIVRVAGIARIGHVLGTGFATVLPWGRLARTGLISVGAMLPVVWFSYSSTLPRPLVLVIAAVMYAGVYIGVTYVVSREPTRIPTPPVPSLSQ